VKERTEVILYSRPGCHLCDEMKEEIAKANCAELYTLKEINIENDPVLLARYKFDIPVLLIDGVEMFRHRLRAKEFRTKLFSDA